MSEIASQTGSGSDVAPQNGTPPTAPPPTTSGERRWSRVQGIGVAIAAGIAIGILLGVRYLDLQRNGGCELFFSPAAEMFVMMCLGVVGVAVLGGLMLLPTASRRAGQILLLGDASTAATFWLILAQFSSSPC